MSLTPWRVMVAFEGYSKAVDFRKQPWRTFPEQAFHMTIVPGYLALMITEGRRTDNENLD